MLDLGESSQAQQTEAMATVFEMFGEEGKEGRLSKDKLGDVLRFFFPTSLNQAPESLFAKVFVIAEPWEKTQRRMRSRSLKASSAPRMGKKSRKSGMCNKYRAFELHAG